MSFTLSIGHTLHPDGTVSVDHNGTVLSNPAGVIARGAFALFLGQMATEVVRQGMALDELRPTERVIY